MKYFIVLVGLLVASLSTALPGRATAAEKIILLGTAEITGVYYPTGGAICRLVNRARKEHGIRCVVESTNGSISNLSSIINDDLHLGIVQSDWLHHVYSGNAKSPFNSPYRKLRVLFSLHSEPLSVLVRSDSPIQQFSDLRGRTINIGAIGSGVRGTVEQLFDSYGWGLSQFKKVTDYSTSDQGNILCENGIDAAVYAVGHPNEAITKTALTCNTRLIPLADATIASFVASSPFYFPSTIEGKLYAGHAETIDTFGFKAMLVASEDLDEQIVYQLVKTVFENLENFKTLHPVFASLDAEQMSNDTGDIPLHPGALRYFREAGLIP